MSWWEIGLVRDITRCVRCAFKAILLSSILKLVSTNNACTKSMAISTTKVNSSFSSYNSLICRFLIHLTPVFLNDVGSADKSRSPKVEHFSVLVKALKWPPNQLFPGTWIVISFYLHVANLFYDVGKQGVYEGFASKQIRHYFFCHRYKI